MREFKIRCSQIGKIMDNSKNNELPVTAISYLKSWYAEEFYCYHAEIHSKYLDKGNFCEHEAIDICAEKLGLGVLFKNQGRYENDYIEGTPDAITENLVLDTKCSWDGKTFLDSVVDPVNSDYEYQLRGYMDLLNVTNGKLCYLLLDTPEDVNYGQEVIFSSVPIEHRFYCVDFIHDQTIIIQIYDRVAKCRKWLLDYDKLVKSKLGLCNLTAH